MKQFNNVYQFKISLKEIEPLIWRRIQVPVKYSFWELHIAIQSVMGWLDYHLHQFHVINPTTEELECIGNPGDDQFEEPLILPSWEKFIADYFVLNKNIVYEYDFGDSWEHDIVLEKILPKQVSLRYPICLEGERACPPEDCGGVGGYENFLEIIKNPKHEEYKATRTWAGRKFNPEVFNPSKVIFKNPNSRLKAWGY